MKDQPFQPEDILEALSKNHILSYDQIPNIDLYIDQVTTFVDEQLSGYKRGPDDKIITKMMVNNYSKDKLLPPSNKKKYTKNHILQLVLIYHMKKIMSISDIDTLLQACGDDLTRIYEVFTDLQRHDSETLANDTDEKMKMIEQACADSGIENEKAKLLLFVLSLVIDANNKKQMAEKIIDTYFIPRGM